MYKEGQIKQLLVYERLGFEGEDDKNRYIPEIVKERRSQLLKASL